MLSGEPMRQSLQVAPLTIHKSYAGSNGYGQADQSSGPYSQSQMTPPATPNGSQEDLNAEHPEMGDENDQLLEEPMAPPVFHNFLRAFYPFHPSYAMTDSTVTLPLNEGDVILVHSIHTNGWADGTLLVSGARGWLPTNYCEAYDPEEMKNLLKALLNFWDLLRSTSVNDSEVFGNQEFMKGIIAGVRYLLERTQCLTRESPTIQRNDHLRRARKSLLSELSSLVKTAKRLQEAQRGTLDPPEDVNDIIDEMILKAFKIVTKGVRFLDFLEEDRRMRAPAVTVMATVMEESVPPTPPADSHIFDDSSQRPSSDASSRATHETGESSGATYSTESQVQQQQQPPAAAANITFTKRTSSLFSPAGANPHRLSQSHGNRMSANLSHRVSLAGPSSLSRPQNLVSERLNRSHDNFLSHLGSFIGRLHLQAQSRPELALAIRQSATSGGELLVVVDVVRTHSTLSSESLNLAREAMYERIRDLVFGGREILRPHGPDEDDVLVPQDNGRLLDAATGCVKAAGECVAKTKWVIERIGDFELDNGVCAEMAIDFGLDILPEEPAAPVTEEPQPPQEDNVSVSKSTESKRLSLRPLAITIDKPLPEVPLITTPIEASPEGKEQQHYSPASSRPQSYTEDVPDSMASSVSSIRPTAPQLPPLSTSLTSQDDYSPLEPPSASNDGEFHSTFRGESMTASSTGSNSTYLSRDSESSLVSQTSTRATTPDHTLMPKPSISELSVAASSTIADEVEDVESKLLAKTYAHELMINKDGQVSGGSLPALVERLTTHESTPDAMFVSTFYLTFRLFCTPEKLAEALIDRFDYVADSPHMTSPVRLRVYNVFKGWLESHWRHDVDKGALKLITPFAESKLGPVLPAAGKRLLELTQRVSSHDGSLVPRLVSSMGKTNTSIATYIPADTPLPSPALTKSQANALASWRNGSGAPTILDFEPLEIARQLTLKQMAIFCSIMPEELLASSWMKKGGVDSPNVKAMVTLSNDLTNLVADTILHHNEVKKRAAVIKQWIKVAHQCLELNNYDALMAIIASLNSSIISRLRRTWDVVSPKRREMLRSLQAIVEPSNNNKVLRNRLQNHVPPCLPFLGMFLTDLTFVDIGNPATKQLPSSPNGINTPIQYRDGHHNGPHDSDTSSSSCLTVVNFDKHMRTARIIGDLQRFQIPYRLMEVPDLRDWLDAQFVRVRELDQASVQVTYYRKSLLLEPREVAAAVAASSASAASPSSGLSALGVGNSSSATLLPLRPTTSNGESGGSRLTGWMSKDRQGSVTSAI